MSCATQAKVKNYESAETRSLKVNSRLLTIDLNPETQFLGSRCLSPTIGKCNYSDMGTANGISGKTCWGPIAVSDELRSATNSTKHDHQQK